MRGSSAERAATWLSSAQVVDAAVADPQFAAYLGAQELASGREEIACYDAESDALEVGVMPWYETEPPRIHGALVHPVTGAILGILTGRGTRADGFAVDAPRAPPL